MASSEADVNRQHDDSHVTAQQWKWTVLAGMASYLDAGSIVALAAGLALWQEYLGMSSTTVGLLAALGPNAFGAAIGALIGGRLGDLFGRKRIYQYDLLVYGLGTLLIVFSVNLPMLLIGTFIVGVAVGADVPTSLALIGEFSPSKARGKLMGLSQVAWSLGPDSRICAGVRALVVRRAREQDSLRPPVRGRDSHVGPQAWHGGVRHLDRRLGRRRGGAHVRP